MDKNTKRLKRDGRRKIKKRSFSGGKRRNTRKLRFSNGKRRNTRKLRFSGRKKENIPRKRRRISKKRGGGTPSHPRIIVPVPNAPTSTPTSTITPLPLPNLTPALLQVSHHPLHLPLPPSANPPLIFKKIE